MNNIFQQCYPGILNRSKLWLPSNLAYIFMAEAKRLWELEDPKTDRLTTIQAAVNLSATLTSNGLDQVGLSYMLQGIAIADRIDLFGPAKSQYTGEMQQARIFTAWSLFTWQTYFCYYFFRCPFIESAPQTPLPDPVVNPQWFGEVWLRYPIDQTLTPLHIGHILKSHMGMCHILNDIAVASFKNPETQGQLSVQKTLEFKRRLDTWFERLPIPLQPQRAVHPSHLRIQ